MRLGAHISRALQFAMVIAVVNDHSVKIHNTYRSIYIPHLLGCGHYRLFLTFAVLHE